MDGQPVTQGRLYEKLAEINTFVFDVDGVLTDGTVLVTESGDLLRTMNTRDGQGIKTALEKGFHVGIITKGASEGVRKRFENLGVFHIFDKVTDKSSPLKQLMKNLGVSSEQVLYMGDDIPDVDVYHLVGVSSCPSNAAADNLSKADYVSPLKGGHGCVREIIEKVMRLQGKWPIY
jgi:3-deoxy-D-manno-octulosonate 8-phosphate phosphatase (KDO 8-P phosphatase)